MHLPVPKRPLIWLCCSWCLLCCVSCADWRSCASPAAAFDIQGISLQPEVVPPGGSLSLVVDVNNKQASVTAGSGTVKVYYYGWWVLTASGSMCDAPPAVQQANRGHFASSATSISTAHRRSLLRSSQDSTSWSTATWITSSTQPQQELSLPAAAGNSAASPAHHLWGPVQDDTCVLPTGPLKLYHQATLPGIAPRGNYRMQLSAADVNNGMELFCLDVWFKVA